MTSNAITLRGAISKDGPLRIVSVTPLEAYSNYHYKVAVKDPAGAPLQEWELRNGVPLAAADVQWVDVNADGYKDIVILGGTEAGERWYKTWLYQERDGKYAWINGR